MEIKNLKKAANRILKAISSKERIILYGDADLDGASSVIILKECIKNLGGKITAVYFPDREDGYGINEKALKYLKKYAPALFLVLDCGIGNFKEVEIARELGFEVIIIDHHEILDKLPSASIIVDPKQKGDNYPFKYFANVGIVFRLAKLLLKEKMSEGLRRNFLELVAMATIADMMPMENENKVMIEQGLEYLKTSWRPGIQVLFGLDAFKSLPLFERVSKVNSLLNIRDIENELPVPFRLLTSLDKKEAEKLAKELFEKSIRKKAKIREILKEVERKISEKSADSVNSRLNDYSLANQGSREVLIFEGGSDWELILLGVVASILTKEERKPVFLFKKGKIESQGSVRAPAEFNVVEAMKSCSKNLITYGGHPRAAGFGIKNENLKEFKQCLVEYFEKYSAKYENIRS